MGPAVSSALHCHLHFASLPSTSLITGKMIDADSAFLVWCAPFSAPLEPLHNQCGHQLLQSSLYNIGLIHQALVAHSAWAAPDLNCLPWWQKAVFSIAAYAAEVIDCSL